MPTTGNRQLKTLFNISPFDLTGYHIPDEDICTIWLGFKSAAGTEYTAIHVFNEPIDYIIVTSKDRNRQDFLRVRKMVAQGMEGFIEGGEIRETSTDIRNNILSLDKLTQLQVLIKSLTFYAVRFSGVTIQAVYYYTRPKTTETRALDTKSAAT